MTLISLCCSLPRVESDIFQPVPDSPREPEAKTKEEDDDKVTTYPFPPKNNNINWVKAERSWSGNLTHLVNTQMDPFAENPKSKTSHLVNTQMDPFAGKPKFNHRRFYSLSEVDELNEEPKLVRSSGVRRNWSFEDIENNNE